MSRFFMIDDTVKDKRAAFFAPLLPSDLASRKGCRLIGAVDSDGIPEGAAVFTVNDFIADILHIEVYPELRRRGIGTALIGTLLECLSLTGLSFMVQAAYSVDEDGEDRAIDLFFRSLSAFEVVSGGKYCTVTPDTIWNPERLKLISSYECSVTPYTELSRAERNRLIKDMQEKNLSSFLLGDDGKLIPELSLCHMENDRCTTCVIFRESELPDTVELSFLMSEKDDMEHLTGVLNEVVRRFKELYPKYSIVFCLVNMYSELIAKRFFKKYMRVSEVMTAVSFGEI